MDIDQTADSPHRPPRLAALIVAAAGVAALWVSLCAIIQLPGIPYNVRELFPEGREAVSAFLFSVLLLVIGVTPGWAAGRILQSPRWMPAAPLMAGVAALGAWVLLRLSVKTESIDDILGSPVLGWGWDWEYICRFLALYGAPALVLVSTSAAVRAWARSGMYAGVQTGLGMLLVNLPWFVLAHFVVIEWACTDNLTELIRADPYPGDAFLLVLVLLVGLNAATVAHVLRRPSAGLCAGAAVATVLLVPAGWALLDAALVPDLTKYDITFPAARFLLGLDRQTHLSETELVFRWGLVQGAAVLTLAVGQLVALLLQPAAAGRLFPTRQGQADELQGSSRGGVAQRVYAAPGRGYLILLLGYLAFAIYGSLVPLEYQGKPLDQALNQFLKTPYLMLHIQNRADLVANLLLYIPLTFFAMGAWTRENQRPGRCFMAVCVTAAACVVAVLVEFFQIYFPPRTVSLNDILAECIGGAAGVAAWFLLGDRVTGWVRNVWRLRDRRRLAIHVLSGYAVAFVVYELYPFDFTISGAELADEIRKIRLIPFADWTRLSLLVVGAKAAMLIPIGYLVAVVRPRTGSPVRIASLAGGLLALTLQTLHLFIHSRATSATDVVLGMLGAGVGGWMAGHIGPVSTRTLLWSPFWRGLGWIVRLVAATAGLAALVWYKWQPLDLQWPKEGVLACAVGWVRIPFFHQYWNTEFQATTQVGQDFGAPLILGILWMSVLRRLGTAGRVVAAAIAAGTGAVVEAGQLFFPPRVPDLTTVLIAIAGGILGIYLYDWLIWVFVKAPSAEDEPPGPCSPT